MPTPPADKPPLTTDELITKAKLLVQRIECCRHNAHRAIDDTRWALTELGSLLADLEVLGKAKQEPIHQGAEAAEFGEKLADTEGPINSSTQPDAEIQRHVASVFAGTKRPAVGDIGCTAKRPVLHRAAKVREADVFQDVRDDFGHPRGIRDGKGGGVA